MTRTYFHRSVLLLVLIFSPVPAAESRETKRVLVLYSEGSDNPSQGEIEQAIRAGFRSDKLFDVQLYTEYLDVSRFGDLSHARTMADFLRRKYSGMKIDTIITIYPYALDFLLAERRALFPEVPVIAALIIRSYAENLERSPARRFVTGTIVGDDITGLMDVALLLRPETKSVTLVAGTAPTDLASEQIYRAGLRPYADKFGLIDLTKLSLDETLSRVGSLSPDTVVFYSSIFRDGAGTNFVPREVLPLIARAAKVPVFNLYETGLGLGIVGGRLASLIEHGKEAAALALRVMGGESPASIPFGGEQAYVSAYDWRELNRWGISEKALPPGSIVKFKPLSLWEEHGGTVLAGLLFVSIETLLVIGLFVNLHKRRRLEGEILRVSEDEQRRLGSELHDGLCQHLTAALLHCTAFENGMAVRNMPEAGPAGRLRAMIEESIGMAYDVSRGLCPVDLNPDALASALERLARQTRETSGLACGFRCEGAVAIRDPQKSLHLFRIAQEAVTNAVKHAHGCVIQVELLSTADSLTLRIQDDGVGKRTDAVADVGGMGVPLMKHRAETIGGTLTMDHPAGGGTIVTCRVPWEIH